MENQGKNGETSVLDKTRRKATVSPERLEAMLRGEHVLPYVRELFGQDRDNNFLPTLSTCPAELTLPSMFYQKIADMTRRTLEDTRERFCFGYLKNSSDPLEEVRFHLDRTSKPFSYYRKRGEQIHVGPSNKDLIQKEVKVPLISIHTHPPIQVL